MERNDRCPLYKKCGGCQLQNLSYEEQLSYKQVKVIRLLGQFTHVDEIIGMKKPTHYRNKVQAAFGTDRRGNVISGVYQSSTHKIVPVEKCMIEDEKADEIIGTIRKLMPSFKMKSYDENRGTGLIRHVLIKRGFKSGQIMVVIVTAKPMFPSRRAFVNALLQRHPEITTVIHNVNDGFTSLVLGKHSEVVYGDGKIEEQLLDCTYRISPSAFYQINPAQTEVLYSKAMEFA
ncbi:MAG: class I SAM-dependent RNA methyltransferase, partial [Oscillospiraceae bacterium]|nr:class I SAM-dependent RNA methyltransferase [Oscillospiraceae bacterium]